MKDKLMKCLIILLFLGMIGLYIGLADFSPKSSDIELLNKISELESKIDEINNQKDSIRIVIDSTHVKIIENEKHYQERINTIITQSSSADSSFITDYIRLHRSKRDSTNIR